MKEVIETVLDAISPQQRVFIALQLALIIAVGFSVWVYLTRKKVNELEVALAFLKEQSKEAERRLNINDQEIRELTPLILQKEAEIERLKSVISSRLSI